VIRNSNGMVMTTVGKVAAPSTPAGRTVQYLESIHPVVAIIAPASATLVDGTHIVVDTEYPFGDTVNITVTIGNTTSSKGADTPHQSNSTDERFLYVRVPGWADGATVSVNHALPTSAPNGTLLKIPCGVGSGGADGGSSSSKVGAITTTVTLALNPSIVVSTGWGSRIGSAMNKSALDEGGFERFSGALTAGGDIESGNYTLVEAEAHCNK
jgi:hypothetical protein